MRNLTANLDNFDHTGDIKLEGVRGACSVFVASTHPDYKDGPSAPGEAYGYALLRAAVLKDKYTDKDRAEREHYAAQEAIKNGEHVLIDGVECTVKINGNYSDAARFERV